MNKFILRRYFCILVVITNLMLQFNLGPSGSITVAINYHSLVFLILFLISFLDRIKTFYNMKFTLLLMILLAPLFYIIIFIDEMQFIDQFGYWSSLYSIQFHLKYLILYAYIVLFLWELKNIFINKVPKNK
jgi:hypothetical protein